MAFDPNQPRDEDGKWTEGSSVRVTGNVVGKGKKGVISQVSRGGFYGVKHPETGKHIGYYNQSDLTSTERPKTARVMLESHDPKYNAGFERKAAARGVPTVSGSQSRALHSIAKANNPQVAYPGRRTPKQAAVEKLILGAGSSGISPAQIAARTGSTKAHVLKAITGLRGLGAVSNKGSSTKVIHGFNRKKSSGASFHFGL